MAQVEGYTKEERRRKEEWQVAGDNTTTSATILLPPHFAVTFFSWTRRCVRLRSDSPKYRNVRYAAFRPRVPPQQHRACVDVLVRTEAEEQRTAEGQGEGEGEREVETCWRG